MRLFSRLSPSVRSYAALSLQRSTLTPISTKSFQMFAAATKPGFRSMSSTTHLSDVLAEQIKEEEENTVEFDAIKNTPVPEGWKMEIKETEGLIILTKSIGSETATLTVNAYELESDESKDEFEEEGEQHEETDGEDSEGANFGTHVTLELSKNGGSKLTFEGVAWSKSGFELSALHTDKDEAYAGPRFNDLDETLIEAFHEYLADMGVNDELAAFVAGHAWRTEHFAYRSWLTTLSAYVQHK